MSTLRLYDPGLQAERTQLAWRRTVLGIAVGSLVAMRLLPAVFSDPIWVLPGTAGVLFAGVVWLAARHRYRRANNALLGANPGVILPGGGVLMLVLASFTTGAGMLGLALVIAIWGTVARTCSHLTLSAS